LNSTKKEEKKKEKKDLKKWRKNMFEESIKESQA